MRQLRGHGPLLALLSAGRFLAFMARLNIVPFYPELMARFKISYTGAGSLYSAFFIGYALSLIPAGSAADRWHPRRLLILGLAMVGLTGGAVALAATFPIALAARVVEGIAVAVVFTATLKLLAVRFTRETRGKAIGVTEAATGLGMLASLSILPLLSRWIRYDALLAGLPALCGVVVLLSPLTARGPSHPAEPPRRRLGVPLWHVVDSNMAIITLASLLGLFVVSGILGWLPTHLTESLGYSKVGAGLVTGIVLTGQTVGLYPAGSLSDRTGRRLPVVYTGTTVLMLATVGLALLGGAWIYPLAVVLGLGISWSVSPLTIIIMERFGPERAGILSAITVAVGQVGSGLAGVAFGWVLDRTGDFGALWTAAAALCAVRLLIVSRIREGGPPAGDLSPGGPQAPGARGEPA